MSDRQPKKANKEPKRVRLTAQLTLAAYNAISDVQRQHRAKTGRALPIWKVLDQAVREYAKRQGIAVGE